MPRVMPPFCTRCGGTLPHDQSRLCPRCRTHRPRIDCIRSVFLFQGTLREAVHRFKYDGLTVLATPLGGLMAAYLREHPLPADVLVPVPLHPARVRERGYNQSALLVQAMARDGSVPVDMRSLVRRRATVPQVGLGAGERAKNVAGAFFCTGNALAGNDVLLVDDVCTTGATLEACAAAVREAGARSVRALTLARANFGDDAR